MKRYILLLLSVFVVLFTVGCDGTLYTVTYPEPVIVHPDNETAQTINGYREKYPSISSSVDSSSEKPSNSSQNSNNEAVLYCGNKSTKKLHLATCRYAKNLASEKKIMFEDYNDAISMGYVDCKVCLK